MRSWLERLFSRASHGQAHGRANRRPGIAGRQGLQFESLEDRQMLSWTVMTYIAADNDLEDAVPVTFTQMSAVGSTSEVKLVTLIDSAGKTPLFDRQAGARRGQVLAGQLPDRNWGEYLGNVDSGDPVSLATFVTWAKSNYASDHYALILSNHGNGVGGVCSDDTSQSQMSIPDLSTVMDTGAFPHLDVLGFDACLMAMVEVGYQFRANADVLVASEETVPHAGFNYQPFLQELVGNPSMNAQALGDSMVRAYAAAATASQDATRTLASIDLAKVANTPSGAVGTLAQFADAMLSTASESDWIALWSARNHAQQFDYQSDARKPHPSRDIVDLMTRLESTAGLSPAIAAAAGSVVNAARSAVLANYAGPERRASGLSVYYPAPGDADLSAHYTSDLRFVADTKWSEVVRLTTVIDVRAAEAAYSLLRNAAVPGAVVALDAAHWASGQADQALVTVATTASVNPARGTDVFSLSPLFQTFFANRIGNDADPREMPAEGQPRQPRAEPEPPPRQTPKQGSSLQGDQSPVKSAIHAPASEEDLHLAGIEEDAESIARQPPPAQSDRK